VGFTETEDGEKEKKINCMKSN